MVSIRRPLTHWRIAIRSFVFIICCLLSSLAAAQTLVPIMVGDIIIFVPVSAQMQESHVYEDNMGNLYVKLPSQFNHEYIKISADGTSVSKLTLSQIEALFLTESTAQFVVTASGFFQVTPAETTQPIVISKKSGHYSLVNAAIDYVDIRQFNMVNASFQVHWFANASGGEIKLWQQHDAGSWQELSLTEHEQNSKSFTNKVAGSYRYKAQLCYGVDCSDAKISPTVTVQSLQDNVALENAQPSANTLSDLHSDVGVTAGQFRVSESGAATYQVPLSLPAGVAGVTPSVALSYSSQAGAGILGHGWSLGAGGAISRCPKNLYHHGEIDKVHFDSRDIFCLDGQPLKKNTSTDVYGADGTEYHTLIDRFSLITSHGSATDSGPMYFTVETKAGDTFYYGAITSHETDAFVEPNQVDGDNDLAKYWALKKVVDIKGNAIVYHYSKDTPNGSHYLASIEYGGNDNITASSHFNEVTFNYSDNPKPAAGYTNGSTVLMNKLLTGISITVDDAAYRYYGFDYFSSDVIEERNYLDNITECLSETDFTNEGNNNCRAPLSFTWQRPDAVTTTMTDEQYCGLLSETVAVDCEMITTPTEKNFAPFSSQSELVNLASAGLVHTRIFDINGDGYSDVIYEKSGWKVKYGPSFSESKSITSLGSDEDYREYARVIDYDGDGTQDLLVANSEDSNWHAVSFSPSSSVETVCPLGHCFEANILKVYELVDLGIKAVGYKGSAQVMDIDGDGLQDIVYASGDKILMYRNNADNNADSDYFTSDSSHSLMIVAANDDLDLDPSLVEHTANMKNSSGIDINGDGRSDLISRVQIAVDMCIVGGGNGGAPLGPPNVGETCAETYETVVAVLVTDYRYEYRVFVSEGQVSDTVNSLALAQLQVLDIASTELRVTDLNGDGLSDVIYRKYIDSKWYYRLSNGLELGEEQGTVYSSTGDNKHAIYFIDLNGDGRADVLRPFNNTWAIHLSRPSVSSDVILWEMRGSITRTVGDNVQFGDINGDGKLDLLTANAIDKWQVQYGRNSHQIEHVITQIDNGWGIKTDISYDNMLSEEVILPGIGVDANIANTIAPVGPMVVVSQVDSDSHGDSSQVSVSYRYAGLLLNRLGLGNLGFKALQTTDAQSGIISTTYYSQTYPYIGMPISTEQVIDIAGALTPIKQAVNTLAQLSTANGGIYPYISEVNETNYQVDSDGSTVHQLASITTSTSLDTWGNVTSLKVETLDSSSNVLHATLTSNLYKGAGGGAAKGRLSETVVTKAQGTISGDCQGDNAICRTSSFKYHSNGLLSSTEVNGLKTAYTYNAFGHKTLVSKTATMADQSTETVTLTTQSQYSDDGRFLSETIDPAQLTTTYFYNDLAANSASGITNKLTVTNANNLSSMQYFDSWGNKIATGSSVAPAQLISTDYCTATTCVDDGHYYTQLSQAGTPTKQTTFSKYGREIVSQTTHFDGGISSRFKEYDSQGRLEKTYVTGYNIAGALATKTNNFSQLFYDNYGRVSHSQLPNYLDSDYVDPKVKYNGLVTIKTDAKGNSTTTEKNLLGQVIKVTDSKLGELGYSYDSYGNLSQVTKIADNTEIIQATTSYNAYGQKLAMNDIDKGIWQYRYNGFNQLVWQKNAENDTVHTVYDDIGRKQVLYGDDFVQCWLYADSNAAAGSRGALMHRRYFTDLSGQAASDCLTRTDFTQQLSFDYDSKGRMFHKTETLHDISSAFNGDYHSYSRFDAYGRVAQSSYPGLGLTITHQYNSHGYATKLINADTDRVYQNILSMNANGQVEEVEYANGVTETIDYYATTGLVKSHNAEQGSSLHQLNYQYDAKGNLTQRQHQFGTLSTNVDYQEDYSYDSLDRLTGRVNQFNQLNGAYSLTESYQYDGFGNFTQKGSNQYYQYHNTTKRLQAVYSNSHFSGTANYQFEYDDNGNIESDGKRVLQYASFDKVIQIYQDNISTGFVYGLDHKRIYRHDVRVDSGKQVDTHTAYLSGLEKIYRTGKGSDLLEYKVYLGNIIITERSNNSSNSSADESYLHKDHLGSPLSITNSSGTLVAQNVYDPWGKVHSLSLVSSYLTNYTVPTRRGFTGHEGLKGLDIIHMNGRIYDPTLGRFLQADPHIQAPKNSQSYNRYAYVLNNPLSYTDPSGYFFKALTKLAGFALGGVIGGIASHLAHKFIANSQTLSSLYVSAVGAITSYFCGPCSIGFTALASANITYYQTGSLKAAFTAGATTGVIAGVFYGIGSAFESCASCYNSAGELTAGAAVGKVAAHAIAGGVMSDLQGGKFGHGFFAAGVTQAFGSSINGIDSGSSFSIARIAAAAVVGGTASKISGGKFANGAVTGAFSRMFNDESHYQSLKTAHDALKKRVLSDATNTDATIYLSNKDQKTILEFELMKTHKYGGDDYVMDHVLADTFIYKEGLTSRNFLLEGLGVVKGGEFNYISVGMMAAHYGHSLPMVTLQSVGWNLRQMALGEGMHNYSQMFSGAFWAGYGHQYYNGN